MEERLKQRIAAVRKIRKALSEMCQRDQVAMLEELAEEIRTESQEASQAAEAPVSRAMGDGVGEAPESSELGA